MEVRNQRRDCAANSELSTEMKMDKTHIASREDARREHMIEFIIWAIKTLDNRKLSNIYWFIQGIR